MKFNISQKAKDELIKFKEKNGNAKVTITGYSWCGANFGIVSEKQKENEKSYNIEGIEIIVSEDLEGAAKGFDIDYDTDIFNRGFAVSLLYD